MKRVMDFLTELCENNDKKWFDANKARYKECQQVFHEFTQELIDAIADFDPTVRGLTVKDCTYRIYRDQRFSRVKLPYKTHMGAYICPGGKKSGYAGYYFHLEPEGGDDAGYSFISSGIYMPEPVVLRSLRKEILDNGDAIADAIERAEGFELDTTDKLRRMPTGFPAGTQYDELLKQKNLYVAMKLGKDIAERDNLVELIASYFSRTAPLTAILNRAVKFAYEEML